jgi:hypothetical protein
LSSPFGGEEATVVPNGKLLICSEMRSQSRGAIANSRQNDEIWAADAIVVILPVTDFDIVRGKLVS